MNYKRFVVFFIFLVSFLSNCSTPQNGDRIQMNSELYKNYINGYSLGQHKRMDPVRVEFSKPIVSVDKIGTEVSKSLYSIYPAIPGKCIWKNVHLLEFYPDKSVLKANVEYQLILDLQTIFPEIDRSLKKPIIDFSFQPLELSVDLKTSKISYIYYHYMY